MSIFQDAILRFGRTIMSYAGDAVFLQAAVSAAANVIVADGDTSGCGSGLSKPSDRSARVLSDEVDAGSAKESASKHRPRDAGLMQWARRRL